MKRDTHPPNVRLDVGLHMGVGAVPEVQEAAVIVAGPHGLHVGLLLVEDGVIHRRKGRSHGARSHEH